MEPSTSTVAKEPVTTERNARRAALASAVGSLVEWYDFALYGAAAALIFNKQFFGDGDPAVGLMGAFATFAVGYFVRPFGGIILGHLGDRVGRKPVMVATLIIMGISTAAIGLLPSFNTVGILAPVLLVGLRIVQGLGAGAEYAGAVILSSESSGPKLRGFYASWSMTGVYFGGALGLLTFQALLSLMGDAFYTWGWRIPFLLSLVILFVSSFIRRRVLETRQFTEVKERAQIERVPLLRLFKTEKRRLLVALGANFIVGLGYIPQVWALSYLTNNVGIAAVLSLGITATMLILGGVSVPLFGRLGDLIGRRKLYLYGATFGALWAFPMFLLIDTRQTGLIVVGLVVGFVGSVAAPYAAQAAFLPELFPPAVRYSGVAFSREVSGALLGGTAPLIATALFAGTGHWWPIATFMVAAALVTVVALYYSKYFRSDADQGTDARFASKTMETGVVLGRERLASDRV